jgi:hypothetical protein
MHRLALQQRLLALEEQVRPILVPCSHTTPESCSSHRCQAIENQLLLERFLKRLDARFKVSQSNLHCARTPGSRSEVQS